MRVTSAIVAGLLLVGPTAASAQSYAIQGSDQYFRVEWQAGQGRKGPVVSGYVYNTYALTADRVRLVVESLDAAGQATGSTVVFVPGTAPPGGRAYFEAPVSSAGAGYRVRVLSYEWIGRGA